MAKPVGPVKDGLIIGIIGYASVAILYAIFDFLAARGFLYTVDLLGKVMFRGLNDPAVLTLPMEPDLTAIFWYNSFHLIASLIIGFIVIGFIDLTERQPVRAQFVLFILILGFIVTVFTVSFLTSEISDLLPLWSILIANILAVISAGYYLIKRHPGIGPHLIYWLSKITFFPFINKSSS